MAELLNERASAVIDSHEVLTVRVRFEDPLHVVELVGELDLAGRSAVIAACASVDRLDVLVDLSGVVFMDCAGYGALMTSRSILERRGGSLALVRHTGEPQRLLVLIRELERGRLAP